MANRTLMLEQLASVFEEEQAQVLAAVIYDSYNDLVRRDDFSDLKVIVREIAETQQRTDQHLVEIAETQQRTDQHLVDLAAAQQRTEQRVEELGEAQQRTAEAQQRTEQRVGELAEAQQRTAEAQQRTEQRVGDLAEAQQRTAEAQQRTEQRVGELAEAQQRTAEAQQRTEYAVQHLAREVGGLSNRMGGDLEDVAAIVIEDALTRELGWQVDELSRVWQTRDGAEEEIDVFGKAHDPSRPETSLWIVGEVKFNLTLRDVERFSKVLERAAAHLDGEIVPVCFCYRIRPVVQEKVLEDGYRLVLSSGRMPK